MIRDKSEKKLTDLTVTGFTHETASESPAPGGGSISACIGAFGAALGTMVANLSSHKAGWDHRWEEFSGYAEKGMAVQDDLLGLVEEDTRAFNQVMAALQMPRENDEEKALRHSTLQDATRYAAEVPLKVMKRSFDGFSLVKAMAEIGNPNSVSDAGVGALCLRSAILGAALNVRINVSSLDDKEIASKLLLEAEELQQQAIIQEQEILAIVTEKIK
jgi:glutamate formiminotransferase/formiminotetrahydrofolate cyclodeaminase